MRMSPPTFRLRSVHADPIAADEVLAARLAGGDVAALDELFRRHAAGLLRLAAALSGSHADGVQGVFVGLARALPTYDERGAVAPWLRAVTGRTTLAYRPRLGRRHEEPLAPAAGR